MRSLDRITGYSKKRIGLREIGGIPTQSLSASYRVSSNMHENRINISDFYDLAFCKCLA